MAEEKSAEEILREEWDLLKTSGLLSQIGCSAGPERISRGIYNWLKWNAIIAAPKNSPYNGYMFNFEISYTNEYPAKPPIVTCKTKIYHMNISLDGDVCVDSIKKEDGWKRAKDISTVLKSIFVILGKPNTDSPYRRELANLFEKNKEEYIRKAKECCAEFAIKIP